MLEGSEKQNALAKSLPGSMTGVRGAVLAEEFRVRGARLMLHPPAHAYIPLLPAPLARAENTDFQQKRVQIKSFLLQRGTGHPILQDWDRIRGPVSIP